MNLLVLDEEFPYPPNTGKRTRSFNLFRRLAARANIRYLAYGTHNSIGAQILRGSGIQPIAVPGRIPVKQGARFYLRLAQNLFSPLPYIVASHYSLDFRRALEVALRTERPDLILCEWTPYFEYLRTLDAPPVVISAHNVESDIWRRYAENETNLFKRLYIQEQRFKVEKFERTALAKADGAIAVSELDAERLRVWSCGTPVEVVDNGVDLDYFTPGTGVPKPSRLVFTGSMDWRPNQDAARFFVSEIFPALRRECPRITCTFVGREPPPDILALQQVEGIHVTGTVDDVRPYIVEAEVYIVPLRVGGGSRLKILEALAMGKAVVSTTIGAEGLGVRSGTHLMIADGPASFAAEVLRLLKAPSERLRLGQAGRFLVENHYGWDTLTKRLDRFLRDVANRQVRTTSGKDDHSHDAFETSNTPTDSM